MIGGLHKKKKPRTGQQALLDILWTRYGKVGALEHKLGVPRQNFINWRNRKGVPIIWCYKIASALKINPYLLNYKEMCRLNCTSEPFSWEELVRGESLGLTATEIERVLKFSNI